MFLDTMPWKIELRDDENLGFSGKNPGILRENMGKYENRVLHSAAP